MHGTLQLSRQDAETPPVVGGHAVRRAMWAALLPLLLLLRPYEGMIQDARIYVGSGVADRDPAGIGQDILFTADGQTGFTALRPVIRVLLDGLSAPQVAMILALVGSLVWLAAALVLCRSLARGRIAWAAAVCILALPADYGAFHTFVYGEAMATPRVFAEAAVMGALAALVGGRRVVCFGLLGVALAFHPLMALPGIGIAAVMLAWDDRRWLVPIAAAAAAVLGAAALKLPLAERLFVPMDATWLAILKERSVNLFPSLWNLETFARTAAQVAAVIVAGTLAPPRVRLLLGAAAAVGVGGLGVTAAFGDRFPLVLITQLQTWRALWPLAVLGNAAVALAAVGLWRAGPAARLVLALLALTFVTSSTPLLAIGLSALTVGLRMADVGGRLRGVPPRVAWIAMAAAGVAIGIDTIASGAALATFLGIAREQNGETIYAFMLLPGVQVWPLVIGALAIALGTPPGRWPRGTRIVAAAGLAAACIASLRVWDSRMNEYRLVEDRGAATDDLRRLLGPAPGTVLWMDDYDEAWFLADRPSFFGAMQGCPILFSRPLAIEWRARGAALVKLGLARPRDLSPWTAQAAGAENLKLSPAAVESVCRAPGHPIAIVASGAQLGAVPPGWPAHLWRPSVPVQVLSGDKNGVSWRKVDVYTVVPCPASDAASPPG